jgi:hypothetical protein
MPLIKQSMLFLLGSIFPQRGFHLCLHALTAINTAWCVAAVFASIFQCVPIAANWDPTIPDARCIDYGGKVLIATNTVTIVTDLVMILLPVPMVWRLNMSAAKRRGVVLTFLAGGGACVVSITRSAFVLKVGNSADASCEYLSFYTSLRL